MVGLCGGCGTEDQAENDPVELVAGCEGGSRDHCSEFTTIDGVTVQLGELGSVMEPNMGLGFETAIADGDSDNNASCRTFTRIFAQSAEQTATLLDTQDLDMALYTVYRPSNWESGKAYPVITWGNGTCAQPEGYGALLRYVASQGFVVIAANSRYVGSNNAMTMALDYIFAANDDTDSPYYQRIDTDRVGAMGHSQGGGATVIAANDDRIKTVIVFNGLSGGNPVKPFLAITGERDIGSPTAESLRDTTSTSAESAYLFFNMVPQAGILDGHLTLMTEPTRVTELTVKWFEYMLNADQGARDWFVGDNCTLCGREAEFNYGSTGLK